MVDNFQNSHGYKKPIGRAQALKNAEREEGIKVSYVRDDEGNKIGVVVRKSPFEKPLKPIPGQGMVDERWHILHQAPPAYQMQQHMGRAHSSEATAKPTQERKEKNSKSPSASAEKESPAAAADKKEWSPLAFKDSDSSFYPFQEKEKNSSSTSNNNDAAKNTDRARPKTPDYSNTFVPEDPIGWEVQQQEGFATEEKEKDLEAESAATSGKPDAQEGVSLPNDSKESGLELEEFYEKVASLSLPTAEVGLQPSSQVGVDSASPPAPSPQADPNADTSGPRRVDRSGEKSAQSGSLQGNKSTSRTGKAKGSVRPKNARLPSSELARPVHSEPTWTDKSGGSHLLSKFPQRPLSESVVGASQFQPERLTYNQNTYFSPDIVMESEQEVPECTQAYSYEQSFMPSIPPPVVLGHVPDPTFYNGFQNEPYTAHPCITVESGSNIESQPVYGANAYGQPEASAMQPHAEFVPTVHSQNSEGFMSISSTGGLYQVYVREGGDKPFYFIGYSDCQVHQHPH